MASTGILRDRSTSFFGMLNHFQYLWSLLLGKKTPLTFPKCWSLDHNDKSSWELDQETPSNCNLAGGYPRKKALRLVSESLDPGPKNCVSPVNHWKEMSAELWRSLQKEEKKHHIYNTLFEIRPDTHPRNVSDDYQRNDGVGEGISFQICPKKVGGIDVKNFDLEFSLLEFSSSLLKGYQRAPNRKPYRLPTIMAFRGRAVKLRGCTFLLNIS